MSHPALAQLALLVAAVALLAGPLGAFMADVFLGRRTWLSPVLAPVEQRIHQSLGLDPTAETSWRDYALAMLGFNAVGCLFVYALQRLQGALPLNPQHLPAVSPHLAFNTAISFVTNTNWQSYGGESTLSYLVQMLGLTVQNFVSAASGIAVLVALTRGLSRAQSETIGSFWVDVVRATLYLLVPLSLVFAIFLVSQGVVQSFAPYVHATFLEPTRDATGALVTGTDVAVGPAASQIAIKDLGTNGGGFFNANSAHPFEDPTPAANLVVMLSLVLLPAALCCTFGKLVGDVRQGWSLLAVMTAIFLPLAVICMLLEQRGLPSLAGAGVDQALGVLQAGGNMEGKELRFGAAGSALYAALTTAASNGSVNAAHDSFTPAGGLVPLWLMQLGEVVFGGVGSGLYGLVVFAVICVFVAGLMIGRTPEYIGKKIEAHEMKMASVVVLVPAVTVLVGTALAVSLSASAAAVGNPGPHGFSEILYALSSAANNNGSAFGGLSANSAFYDTLLGVAMFAGRFWVAIPVLSIAGSLAKKKRVPVSPGTLPTHTPLFVAMLVGVVIIVGALTFIPALALGPIVEELLSGVPG